MLIGVFDSGIGGITVLSELKQQLPEWVNYVYLGDTAHVPYGPKSSSQIQKLSVDCVQLLKSKGIDALVVACNTAASHAMAEIQKVMSPIPVIGVVEPGIEAALQTQPSSTLLVFATRATVRSQAYSKGLRAILKAHHDPLESVSIHEQACPLLVPIIEEGWLDHSILHQTLAEYVRPYVNLPTPGVALLGCTHYPWIHKAFEQALPGWKVINSARAVSDYLQRASWFQQKTKPKKASTEKRVEWIFTDPEAVPEFARDFIKNIGE